MSMVEALMMTSWETLYHNQLERGAARIARHCGLPADSAQDLQQIAALNILSTFSRHPEREAHLLQHPKELAAYCQVVLWHAAIALYEDEHRLPLVAIPVDEQLDVQAGPDSLPWPVVEARDLVERVIRSGCPDDALLALEIVLTSSRRKHAQTHALSYHRVAEQFTSGIKALRAIVDRTLSQEFPNSYDVFLDSMRLVHEAILRAGTNSDTEGVPDGSEEAERGS